MPKNLKQYDMTYMMIIRGTELETNNLNELVEIATEYGVDPATEVYCDGRVMRECLGDFIIY